MTVKKLSLCFSTAIFFLITSNAAYAHPGHGIGGLLHGFFHPLEGLDHLLTAFAVGLWAAQAGGKSIYALPGTFVISAILGGIFGLNGYGLPFAEAGIIFSLGLLGLALLCSLDLPLKWSVPVVSVFGVLHGNSHGLEMTPGLSTFLYCTGFVLATALIHLAGVVSVLTLNRHIKSNISNRLIRISGGMTTLCSILMVLQVL